jgi:Uncharacterized protein conserved in bacteria (DUF2188)
VSRDRRVRRFQMSDVARGGDDALDLRRCRANLEVRSTMSGKKIFVERRREGDYAVRRPGSDRASAVACTQAVAVARAREIDPRAAILVERVRDTSVGKRDKWRKP